MSEQNTHTHSEYNSQKTAVEGFVSLVVVQGYSRFETKKVHVEGGKQKSNDDSYQSKLERLGPVLSAGRDVLPAHNLHLVVHLDLPSQSKTRKKQHTPSAKIHP